MNYHAAYRHLVYPFGFFCLGYGCLHKALIIT